MLPNYLLYLVFIMLLRLYTSVICFMEYVIHILLCASLSSFTFIDVVLVAGTGPWWEYLQKSNTEIACKAEIYLLRIGCYTFNM